MTTTEVLATDDHPVTPAAPQRGRTRRWRRVAAAVAAAVLAGSLAYLVGNEVQANTQYDQAHRSLDLTRSRTRTVDADLATVRGRLADLDRQVTQDSATLADDTTKLDAAKVALTESQAEVSAQNSAIGDLGACLSGVEQALNALAVGDQTHALSELDAVATSCNSAVAADG